MQRASAARLRGRGWLAASALTAMLLGSSWPVAAQAPPDSIATLPAAERPLFAAHPAAAFAGPFRSPDFAGRDRRARIYRTMIRGSLADGPVFAGAVAVAEIRCGEACLLAYATDLRTGRVFELSAGGLARPPTLQLELEYVRDSTLLRAQWTTSDVLAPDWRGVCADYLWTGAGFRLLSRHATTSPCFDGA